MIMNQLALFHQISFFNVSSIIFGAEKQSRYVTVSLATENSGQQSDASA